MLLLKYLAGSKLSFLSFLDHFLTDNFYAALLLVLTNVFLFKPALALIGASCSKLGSHNIEQIMQELTPNAKRSPKLESPRWEDIVNEPKPSTVVSPATNIPLKVLLFNW